jgi:hypothetical protein
MIKSHSNAGDNAHNKEQGRNTAFISAKECIKKAREGRMKRTIGFALLTLIVFSLIQIFSPQLEAQDNRWNRNNQSQDRVCFYTDADYRGENFCVNANESQPRIGNYSDRISSIRIFGNAQVTVYQDSNFNGSRETITQDTPHLGDWSDRISSFQTTTTRRQLGMQPGRRNGLRGTGNEPVDGVCFYTDANYGGEDFCVEGNESQQSVENYNDRISSIRFFGNAQVTVFEDTNFNGSRKTITQDMPHLGDWNDRISSFQTTAGRQYGRQTGGRFETGDRGPRKGACFFTDANYDGERFCLKAGDSQRALEGRFKDRISSIQIFGSARVIVYENSGFGGANKTFTRDVSNLEGTFNDRISSIEVR